MIILEKLDIADNQEEIKKLTSKKDELQTVSLCDVLYAHIVMRTNYDLTKNGT